MNFFKNKFYLSLTVGILSLALLVSILWAGGFIAGYTDRKTESKTIKVLTVGNSFADDAVSFLSEIAESVPGHSIHYTKANIGGCSLAKHVSLIIACEEDSTLKPYAKEYCLKDLLQADSYDFVTIQQVSSMSFKWESFQPYAGELIEFIREYQPQTEIIIQQTWAYPNVTKLEEWGITYDEMHAGLVESYKRLASGYKMRILPVGEAIYNAYQQDSTLNLWREDVHHANENGRYLAGCVWFGTMTGVSPKKVKFIPEGMDEKIAAFLRKMADSEIKRQKREN